MSQLTAKQQSVFHFLNNVKTEVSVKTISEHLELTDASIRSLLNALVKKELVIKNGVNYIVTPSKENQNPIKSNSEVNTVAKLTEEQKAENKAAREAAKAEKQAEAAKAREAAKAEKTAESEAKAKAKAEKQAAKAAEKAEREKNKWTKEVITLEDGTQIPGYPKPGGKTRAVWDALDGLVASAFEAKTPVADRKTMINTVETDNGINRATVNTQYAQWRAYHIQKGNFAKIEESRAAVKAEKAALVEAEKAKAKAEKQAEKEKAQAAKAAEKAAKDAAEKAEKAEKAA